MFSGSGIVVVDVTPDSGVGGPGGLVPGDVILGVQGRDVGNISDYRAALAAWSLALATPTLLHLLYITGRIQNT